MTRPAPDGDLYPFDDFRHAQEAIRQAVEEKVRYVLLTGESGSGKTVLLRSLRTSLDPCRYRVVYFNLARLSPAGLVRVLARALRMPVCRSQPETIQSLARLMADEPMQTLLWVDEAQLLPDDTFAELRTLSEADLDGTTPVTALLVGLPVLRDRLQAPHLFPLWRRLLRRIEITGLRRDEAAAFAAHAAGAGPAGRFSEEALSILFEHSRGLPGLLAPYIEIVLRSVPEGPISGEAAEAAIQRWNLP